MRTLEIARVLLVLSLTSIGCSPAAPEVRPTPIDPGDAEAVDTGPAPDAASSDDASSDDASSDAPASPDAHDDRAPDFRLVLLDRPLEVARGETAPLRVRIERVGGLDAPVLIDLWGLPDTLWAQARESRVGDDVIELTVEASEDAEPVADTPFAIEASTLGIRHVERTTITIR